jgi:putative oxidoreductase
MTTAQPFERPSASGDATVGLGIEQVAGPIGSDADQLVDRLGRVVRLTSQVGDQVGDLSARLAVPILRCTLALVYLWFGGLKITGRSDIFGLIAVTLPFVNPHVFVPLLGVFEILLGLTLLSGRMPRLVVCGLLAHLAGTFLTFIKAPSWMWHHGNPLLLTMDGEFVLKNLVLISAALVLMGVTSRIRVGSTAELPVAQRT